MELSRQRCFDNFIVNLLDAIAAYCLFPKKPCINVQRTINTHSLFCLEFVEFTLLYALLPTPIKKKLYFVVTLSQMLEMF